MQVAQFLKRRLRFVANVADVHLPTHQTLEHFVEHLRGLGCGRCEKFILHFLDGSWVKQGQTRKAYKLLAPLLKKLVLPAPPSGRAAYSLGCFCGALGKTKEGIRWLKLAYNMSLDKDDLRTQALLEPDLRDIWPSVAEFSLDAYSVLE